VDTEHILAKDAFSAGLFASYHIYPYYPEFMMYQPEYINYVDGQGKINPYQAYLIDLRSHHSVPLLVAEFGIPSSRGCTHINVVTGYNQGFVTEQQQGEYVADMFDSIVASDCAGGLIFTWQDEWFKRSWNTMDYDVPERRPYWSNCQVSEQTYGLMSFEPGAKRPVCLVDGDITLLMDNWYLTTRLRMTNMHVHSQQLYGINGVQAVLHSLVKFPAATLQFVMMFWNHLPKTI